MNKLVVVAEDLDISTPLMKKSATTIGTKTFSPTHLHHSSLQAIQLQKLYLLLSVRNFCLDLNQRLLHDS
jgi:hypothetical protein